MTRPPPEQVLLAGTAGAIETVIEVPAEAPRGIALVAHPHPLYGGSLDNKVAQTLARAFVELGHVAVRPNFRGVGGSEGEHDHGNGEATDLAAIAGLMQQRFGALPLVLAGYSFGGFVQTRVAGLVAASRLVLIAPAVGRITGGRDYDTQRVPEDTLIIHGDVDETVPLANVLAWANPQELPIVVIPGCDHFFHRKLHIIRAIVKRAWPS
jgi:uncharacterized protein